VNDPAVHWPLSPELRAHVEQIATLIRQFGAARFTEAPIARADDKEFPEVWEPTIAGVQRVVHRLCWLAHWAPEVVVNDVRPIAPPTTKMLIASEIELAPTANGKVTLDVATIGNDDVAGLLSHRLGQAFVELAPGDPFRTAGGDVTETQGSVAAVFLGLGVLVANSSMYRRYASKIVARVIVEEQYVAEVGGLSIGEATFLLALQDIVRDDASDALATLHKPQREWLERWRDVLDEHEAELRVLLGLADAPDIALSRSAAPRAVTAAADRDVTKFNAGRTTFRVKERPRWRVGVGVVVGALGFGAPFGTFVGPALMTALGGLGLALSREHYVCTDSECRRIMRTLVDTCPGCGGWIAETIAHANDRLDALERIEAQQRGEAP
jgi:hypothetical protein